MPLGRRSFVFLLAGLGFWAKNAAAAVIGAPTGRPYPLTAFAPYLDTLIPRDVTGSASDFGIDRKIIDHASKNKRHIRLLRAGCQWLDLEARKLKAEGFAALDTASQEVIVARAAEARERSLPRVFFNVTRDDALQRYYSDPRSWQTLGFAGPPQPAGFLDHAEAPQ